MHQKNPYSDIRSHVHAVSMVNANVHLILLRVWCMGMDELVYSLYHPWGSTTKVCFLILFNDYT